eukprot:4744478-Karenia_brevis.AAC.1
MRPKYFYKLYMDGNEAQVASQASYFSNEAQVLLQASYFRKRPPCMGVSTSPAQLEVGTLTPSVQAAQINLYARDPWIHARDTRLLSVCCFIHLINIFDVRKVSRHGTDRSIVFLSCVESAQLTTVLLTTLLIFVDSPN